MIKILILLTFFSTVSYAKCKIPEICKTEKPSFHTVRKSVFKPLVPPATDRVENEAASTNQNSSQAVTGNQSVIVNVSPDRQKKTKRTIIVYRHSNRLQLLIGQSKTRNYLYEDCCFVRSRNKYESDFGLQYLRDFGRFTGSILYTNEGNRYIGLGVNF